ADHRVTGDPAQFARDLARREAVRPQFLEHFDAFVRPRHGALHQSGIRAWSSAGRSDPTESYPRAGRTMAPPDGTQHHYWNSGNCPPHEMSYQPSSNLQYSVTPTQESARARARFPQLWGIGGYGPRLGTAPTGRHAARADVDRFRPHNMMSVGVPPGEAAHFISGVHFKDARAARGAP